MIELNIQLDNLRLLLLRKRTDAVTYLLAYPIPKNPITVLRYPYYVILAMPNRV